jgi:hypothetical protein
MECGELHGGVGFERQPSSQQAIKDDAERVDIARWRDGLAAHLLGRDVCRGA